MTGLRFVVRLVSVWSNPGVAIRATDEANTVGAYEAKTHLSELLEKVEAGEEITITKHGSPVARLVPVKKKPTADERAAAVQRIHKLGASLSLRGLKIKDLIQEGRR